MSDDRKIVECHINPGMKIGVHFECPEVFVKYSEADDFESLFTYYSDEISFSSSEFIGLTDEEAHNLKFNKDNPPARKV